MAADIKMETYRDRDRKRDKKRRKSQKKGQMLLKLGIFIFVLISFSTTKGLHWQPNWDLKASDKEISDLQGEKLQCRVLEQWRT